MKTLVGTTLLDRYFLRELIGRGGMADVYQAWDKLRAARMAVKVLRRDLANSPRFFQMFAQEAELLRKLEHPSIVRLYEFDKQDDLYFIVMDWIDGSNLREVLSKREKPLALNEVSSILEPLCSALNYAHQNKVYHCDVKPSNILLHTDGRVLLTDFGVARLASDKTNGGTPQYTAPELLTGKPANAKSDVYSMGICLYEMLSGGKVPFRGDSPSSQGSTTRDRIAWEHSNLPLPSLLQYNPSLPASVENVVTSALSKDPARRYATIMDLREAFEQARRAAGEDAGGPKTIINLISPFIQQISSAKLPTLPSLPSQKLSQPRWQTRHPSTVLPSRSSRPTHGVAPQPIGQAQGPYLLVRSGEWSGQAIPISVQEMTIGRGSNAQLRLRDASVSRLHATIIRTRRGTYIRDEGSSLGTYLNGQPIPPNTPVTLRTGDVIQIGYYQVFEFQQH